MTKEWIMWDLATDAKVIPMWNELYRANKGDLMLSSKERNLGRLQVVFKDDRQSMNIKISKHRRECERYAPIHCELKMALSAIFVGPRIAMLSVSWN
eukprot:3971415-Amphidinium_carterae.1